MPIVRHHHENWDGTGYPDGLRGADIPLGARILSVVDCFDALTSDRPYRRRMSDDEALAIIIERRGTMYDPVVVDTFVRSYREVMPPAAASLHPVAQAIDDARKNVAVAGTAPVAATDMPVTDEVLAFTSLSRVLSGNASLNDAGALLWMMLRQVIPCRAMALFVPDERTDAMVAAYAAGAHAAQLQQSRYPMSQGVIGWAAVNRRAVPNAAALVNAGSGDSALRWMMAMPLATEETLTAVLAVYSDTTPFSEDQARLVELFAPRLAAALAVLADARPAPASDALSRRATPELRVVTGGAAR